MNYLITPRGLKQEAAPKDGTAFSITELQDMVDGFVEIVDLDDCLLVYDVDGAWKDKLFNPEATRLLRRAHREDKDFGGFVAGNAVVCHKIKA